MPTDNIQLPQKIFTVQDEPSSWDDDNQAGLESVSEPDGEASGDSDNERPDVTAETINIPPKAHEVSVDAEEDWETTRGVTSSPTATLDRTILGRPAVGERMRTESWVHPDTELEEARNGASVS